MCMPCFARLLRTYLLYKCSARTNSDQDNMKHVWDVVRGKLLDSLDTVERGSDFRNGVLDEQQCSKRPLSLYAISEGPKIRLLWASLQQLEEEAGTVSIGSLCSTYFDYFLTLN